MNDTTPETISPSAATAGSGCFGYCPACNSDLKIEPDPRMRTGFAVVCDNQDCRDGGGAWEASAGDVREWQRQNTDVSNRGSDHE